MQEYNHKYSARDFENYYSGKMPELEMHDLEKAALQDPFLADALEGYQYTSTPVKDTEVLKQRFVKNKKKSKLFFLQNPAWLKVAAFIILFAGAGYFIYIFNSPQVNQQATNETKQMADLALDSTVNIERDALQKDKPEANEANPMASTTPEASLTDKPAIVKKKPTLPSSRKPDTNLLANNNDVAVNYKEMEKPVKSSPAPDVRSETLITSKAKQDVATKDVVEGQVLDHIGDPVPFATITDVNKNVSIAADANGKFEFITTDSVLRARIKAVGYKTKDYLLAKNENEPIVLEHNRSSNTELVVTAIGKRRNNKNNRFSNIEQILETDSLYGPEEGWLKFNEYILDNINEQANKSGRNYTGEVILSFEANKKGTPIKLYIDQSLCTRCDQEARRLILKGPKWKYSNGKRYEVRIDF